MHDVLLATVLIDQSIVWFLTSGSQILSRLFLPYSISLWTVKVRKEPVIRILCLFFPPLFLLPGVKPGALHLSGKCCNTQIQSTPFDFWNLANKSYGLSALFCMLNILQRTVYKRFCLLGGWNEKWWHFGKGALTEALKNYSRHTFFTSFLPKSFSSCFSFLSLAHSVCPVVSSCHKSTVSPQAQNKDVNWIPAITSRTLIQNVFSLEVNYPRYFIIVTQN